MTTIDKLTRTDTVSAGDVLPVYVQTQGDARGAAISVLQTYMQNNLTFPPTPVFTGVEQFTTQYASPSSNGFSVQINNSALNTHLILTPTGPFAAGTIVLPAVANVVDKQEILVNCTQDVTTLTINGNGALAVTGEPLTLRANDSFRLMYDLLSQTWYQIGMTEQNNFAAGVAAFLASPSSANLLAAMADETGTGSLVFSTSPTLTTPILGLAVASTLQRTVVTKTASFTLAATESWITCNGTGTITVTLPSAAANVGREVMIKTVAAFTVVSASANVGPIAGGAFSTAILAATPGKYAVLVSDGGNWVIMQAN